MTTATLTAPPPSRTGCPHQPSCPPADAVDRDAARVVTTRPEQGWDRLCNGVIVFADTGELLPDGRTIPPHRAAGPHTRQGSP